MKLLIDVGNTRIKWAFTEGDRLIDRGSAEHKADIDAAMHAVGVAAADHVDSIFVGSVMGDAFNGRLLEILDRNGAPVEVAEVVPDRHGIRVAYEDPGTLGVDRWLAMIAVRNCTPGAICAVSAGTAVTFDAVDVTGRHLGGFIWPAPRMAAAALALHTDRIGSTPPAGRVPSGLGVLGTSTARAVGHGSLFAIAAAIDRAAKIVAAGTGSEPKLVITGGDAATLVPWLESRTVVEPDLVLDGLRIVAAATD